MCEKPILDGYEACVTMPKLKENKVTKTIATKKKKSMKQNLDDELRRQAEMNVMAQFGINGTGIGQEENSVVGRRDLFNVPDSMGNA